MNILEEIKALGLTEEQYEACLSDICDKLNGDLDIEWEEIKDKYNLPWNKDVLRKSSGTLFGGYGVAEYFKTKTTATAPSSYIEQMASIRKEKQKLFDERAALNKINREHGRLEESLNILERMITENGKNIFEPITVPNVDTANDMIVCISDVHLGQNVNNYFGEYNARIAEIRFQNYLENILTIQNVHNATNVYVVLIGDLISGSIHTTVRLENRENVVEQTQTVAELIAAFTYELSKHFKSTHIVSVAGNHSRISKKDDVLRDERMDDIVPWYLEAKLGHLENIVFEKTKYDSTIASFVIRGHEYLAVHGDFDAYSESGISKLMMMIRHSFTGVFYGHLHHCSYDCLSNIQLVRSGSFCGTADDYTITKRITGDPQQMVCIANADGLQAFYPINLK